MPETHRIKHKRELTPELDLEKEVVVPVAGRVAGEVIRFLVVFGDQPFSRQEAQSVLQLKSQTNFRVRYLMPALAAGLIERTLPDKPNSPLQQYRLTTKGRKMLK